MIFPSDPLQFAAAHQADAFALNGVAVVYEDVEIFFLFVLAGIQQHLEREHKTGTVSDEQEVIGQLRLG